VTIGGKAPGKKAVISFHTGKTDVKELEKYLSEEHTFL
jgi:hypothetical protein